MAAAAAMAAMQAAWPDLRELYQLPIKQAQVRSPAAYAEEAKEALEKALTRLSRWSWPR